jgi:valyl-tRNA synthetase
MGMLLTSPAGNDLPFDESLCEQGRNFNNKIWNAFRLIKGWKTDEAIPRPEASVLAVKWFDAQLNKTVAEMDDLYGKYRLSEALMSAYKLFWDEFSAWYLEIIKPGYEQPVDAATYQATLGFFDALLRLLHPFMPFITEELWQALAPRQEGESIMIAQMPQPRQAEDTCPKAFETVKEIVGGIRTIRLQKNIPAKERLHLLVAGEHDDTFNPVIEKIGIVALNTPPDEETAARISFLVGTTEYTIPLIRQIDVEEERSKLEDELAYQQGFLDLVMKKLRNANFVSKAPAPVIEAERKKQADAESKIKSLKEAIATFENN